MGSRREGLGKPSVRDWDSIMDSTWIIQDNAEGDPDASKSVHTSRMPISSAPSTMGTRYSAVVEESLSSSSLVLLLVVLAAPD